MYLPYFHEVNLRARSVRIPQDNLRLPRVLYLIELADTMGLILYDNLSNANLNRCRLFNYYFMHARIACMWPCVK